MNRINDWLVRFFPIQILKRFSFFRCASNKRAHQIYAPWYDNDKSKQNNYFSKLIRFCLASLCVFFLSKSELSTGTLSAYWFNSKHLSCFEPQRQRCTHISRKIDSISRKKRATTTTSKWLYPKAHIWCVRLAFFVCVCHFQHFLSVPYWTFRNEKSK